MATGIWLDVVSWNISFKTSFSLLGDNSNHSLKLQSKQDDSWTGICAALGAAGGGGFWFWMMFDGKALVLVQGFWIAWVVLPKHHTKFQLFCAFSVVRAEYDWILWIFCDQRWTLYLLLHIRFYLEWLSLSYKCSDWYICETILHLLTMWTLVTQFCSYRVVHQCTSTSFPRWHCVLVVAIVDCLQDQDGSHTAQRSSPDTDANLFKMWRKKNFLHTWVISLIVGHMNRLSMVHEFFLILACFLCVTSL